MYILTKMNNKMYIWKKMCYYKYKDVKQQYRWSEEYNEWKKNGFHAEFS